MEENQVKNLLKTQSEDLELKEKRELLDALLSISDLESENPQEEKVESYPKSLTIAALFAFTLFTVLLILTGTGIFVIPNLILVAWTGFLSAVALTFTLLKPITTISGKHYTLDLRAEKKAKKEIINKSEIDLLDNFFIKMEQNQIKEDKEFYQFLNENFYNS